jgi:hypothetical protein
MSASSALSAAIATTIGGRGQPYQEVDLMGDWDGTEDNVADHSGKIDDLSATFTRPSQVLTRVAISEHTIANGFAEDIAYDGDSVGNVTVASTTSLTAVSPTPIKFTINLPTVLNAFGNLNSDDEITITGWRSSQRRTLLHSRMSTVRSLRTRVGWAKSSTSVSLTTEVDCV